MKKMKFQSVFFVLLLTAQCFGQDNTETLTVPLSNPGKIYTLKVNILTGSIKVSGYDGNEILISAVQQDEESENGNSENSEITRNRNRNNNDEQADMKGMKKISSHGGFEITAKEADNNVTISTNSLNRKIDLDIRIPQNVKLKLGAVNQGIVSVNNVKGELEVDNVNNDIELKNISGSAVANTVNGDITASFSSVDPQAPMAFSTLNGDINVTFPGAFKANMKLKSDMGDVYSDFDIDIDKTPSKVEKISEPGMYKIKKDDWTYGKVNGGGPEMMFKTMHGDIYVKKATK